MYDLNKLTIARIEALAVKEHRNFEGQLLAMADLYERTYKIKSDQIKKRRGRPPKAAPAAPVSTPTKTRRSRKGTNGFKGKVHTEESRRKIAEARRGRKHSQATLEKMSYGIKLAHARKKIAQLQAQKQLELK